jgi:hypothetical protein
MAFAAFKLVVAFETTIPLDHTLKVGRKQPLENLSIGAVGMP